MLEPVGKHGKSPEPYRIGVAGSTYEFLHESNVGNTAGTTFDLRHRAGGGAVINQPEYYTSDAFVVVTFTA